MHTFGISGPTISQNCIEAVIVATVFGCRVSTQRRRDFPACVVGLVRSRISHSEPPKRGGLSDLGGAG